ncbi:MAG: ABC transporter ATP-binding protein [Dehalococcoidia bacterium]
MPTPVVELMQVSKSFGDVQAVSDLSLRLDSGGVVAFLGPNGAGKTTAISIMLGLRKPTSGQARLLGLDPRDARARSRAGVMLQESGVPESLKVREIINLFRSYYPSPLATTLVIERAGLGEKAGAMIGSLSGGQRQRLYFALAICGDPEVVFLDEPTVALDVEGRRDFWAQVRDFIRSGRTIILTTHYLEEADALADRVIVIDRGRVIADGTPASIKGSVAGKKVSFESTRPLSETDFLGLPVQHLDLSGHHVILLSSEPEQVLKALFSREIDLKDLKVTGAGLEEAFLALTRHEKGA